MSNALFFTSLKAILKNQDGRILALEAQKVGDLSGFYDLPGGRIDDNEIGKPFLELLDREIKEEVGNIIYTINPAPITTLSWKLQSYPNPFVYIYFEGLYESGDIKISDEHLSFKWIDPDKENIDKYFTSFHNQAFSKYLS